MKHVVFFLTSIIISLSPAQADTVALSCVGSDKISGSWVASFGSNSSVDYEDKTISLELMDLTNSEVAFFGIASESTFFVSEQCYVRSSSISCSKKWTEDGYQIAMSAELNRLSGFFTRKQEQNWTADDTRFNKIWSFSGTCEVHTQQKF